MKARKSLKIQAPLPGPSGMLPGAFPSHGRGCLLSGAPGHALLLCMFLGRETLREEELEKQQRSHPANFGPRKYCLRECMCEVEGQVPCPGLVPLPKEMTGKYKATLKAST